MRPQRTGGQPNPRADVSPGRAAQAADREASGELVPAVSRLEGVAGDAAAGQGLHANLQQKQKKTT